MNPVPNPAVNPAVNPALESYNHPGRSLRHHTCELRADVSQGSGTFRADSSFQPVSPWA